MLKISVIVSLSSQMRTSVRRSLNKFPDASRKVPFINGITEGGAVLERNQLQRN